MNSKRIVGRIILFSLFFCLFVSNGWCLSPVSLENAIRQYQQENYEEAIEILKKVREKDARSSSAAFFLGLAYKQTNDIRSALPQFQDAVRLKPAIKEAVVELIDILYKLDRPDEAMKWVETAEKIKVAPANVSFLKGMILMKKGQNNAAIACFEKAKKLETKYNQAADFQIGVALMSEKKYDKAKERFQAAVTQDPLSDLASFARRYQDIVEEQSFYNRPLRVTATILGQYDTNMLVEPRTFSGLPDSGDERSPALSSNLRLDYVPTLPGRWLFNAGYGFSSRVHEKNSTRYDLLGNTLSIAPGYDFGRFALNLSGNYTFLAKRGDFENNGGEYRRYMENFTVGPLLRFMVTPNQIVEAYVGYAKKNYFKPAPIGNPGDDMSACGLDAYLSWMYLFGNGGLFNARVGFGVDHADGAHFENKSYKFSANLIYPLWRKLNLQLGGQVDLVPYDRPNEFFNNEVRDDKIYTGTIGFNWVFNRYLTGLIQYTGTQANSNVMIYDYSRSVWSVGVELRF